MRFVHCSDIHLLDLSGTRPRQFLNKRATGLANLWLRRKHAHDPQLFHAIAGKARALGADRLLVTGDLTNLALDSEFCFVRATFEAVGVPITVVPGNHDVYTRGSAKSGRFERWLAPYMEGERGAGAYPFVQRMPGVAVVGVSSAIPRLPFVASGRIGDDQLERLDGLLARLHGEGRAVVLMVHHPPVDGCSKGHHALLDRDRLARVLARHRVDLVLHGHEHRDIDVVLPGRDGPVTVHGVPSGTSTSLAAHRAAGFSLYDVEPGGIERVRYRWVASGADGASGKAASDPPSGAFVAIERAAR